jgi:hypothetical protein
MTESLARRAGHPDSPQDASHPDDGAPPAYQVLGGRGHEHDDPAAAERRAYARRIDCSPYPTAARTPERGGRHR